MQVSVPTLSVDLGVAWKTPGVKRGCLASCLLFGGSMTPAYLPQTTPLRDIARDLGFDTSFGNTLGTAMVVLAVVLFIQAWLKVRDTAYLSAKHWAIAFWWCLPLVFAPPIFSHDAYAYAAEGWLLNNGLNPYDNPISVLPGAFADQAAWTWRYTPAMYPPLSLVIFQAIVTLSGNVPYIATLLMRVPAAIGVALIIRYLPRVARSLGCNPQQAAWFGALNPLLIIDLFGGMHNDSLMLGLVVLALWVRLSGRRRLLAAAAIVGVAACIKQPAFLAFYPVALLVKPWASLKDSSRALLRLSYSLGISVVVFVAISFVSGLGFGWVNAVAIPGEVVTLAPFTLIGNGLKLILDLFAPTAWGEVVLNVMRVLGLAMAFLMIAWLALSRGRTKPADLLSWGFLAFALGNTSLYPWYLTWGGLLLPLTNPNEKTIKTAVVVTAVLLAYGAGNMSYRNNVFALGFAGLALMIALVWRAMYQHETADESPEQTN